MARLIFIFAILLSLAACSSFPKQSPNVVGAMDETPYTHLVQRNTARTNQYSGFYQTFQADMTMLTSELQNEALKQKARFLGWDQRQYQSERDKMTQESTAYSKFFMRFFTPENDYNDLHKGKSIWRVYLDYGGSRFEGKVKKITDKFVEVQNIYPHLDRFSTPYEITFNVPMATIENGPSKVTLTSSLGTAEFKFPAGK